MRDLKNSIRSLTEFKQNSNEILKYIKKTHNPAALTINGRTEVILLDPESYQELLDKAALVDSTNHIRESLMEMEKDEGIPTQELFQKLRKKIIK